VCEGLRGDGRRSLSRPFSRCVAVLIVALSVTAPSAAEALPGSGPHQSVDIRISTKRVGASAGLTYQASYRNPADPGADPPALRHIFIRGPRGTRSDTSVPTQCTATDQELKSEGEDACPAGSRIGDGWVLVRMLGVGKMRFDTTIFNGPGQQIELVKFGNGGAGVARSKIDGSTVDAPVPTCLNGGQPPDGCPTDQITILSQSLTVEPVSEGQGHQRKDLLTTPPGCPPSRLWRTPVTLTYADGTRETVVTHQPCSPKRRHCHRRKRNCGRPSGGAASPVRRDD
jgi:hypothetical protein